MMKKKLLSLALAGMMVLGLAACGGNGGDTSSDASTDSSPTAPQLLPPALRSSWAAPAP